LSGVCGSREVGKEEVWKGGLNMGVLVTILVVAIAIALVLYFVRRVA
jgi:hypothetical protein